MHILVAEPKREQSHAEEIANSISHGIGLFAAFIGTPFLITHAVRNGDGRFIVGASVFCATIIFLYFASTLYHALPTGKAKRAFRVFEHSAIFVLIAGTYTPFTLGVLNGAWGWTLFGIIWSLAVAGVALKAFYKATRPILFTGLYLLMGWVIVIAVDLYLLWPVPYAITSRCYGMRPNTPVSRTPGKRGAFASGVAPREPVTFTLETEKYCPRIHHF